jgi:hypothetical protein
MKYPINYNEYNGNHNNRVELTVRQPHDRTSGAYQEIPHNNTVTGVQQYTVQEYGNNSPYAENQFQTDRMIFQFFIEKRYRQLIVEIFETRHHQKHHKGAKIAAQLFDPRAAERKKRARYRVIRGKQCAYRKENR